MAHEQNKLYKRLVQSYTQIDQADFFAVELLSSLVACLAKTPQKCARVVVVFDKRFSETSTKNWKN